MSNSHCWIPVWALRSNGDPQSAKMPKIPDDMSPTAVKRRAEASAVSKAKLKAKAAEPVPPPKVRIAKKR